MAVFFAGRQTFSLFPLRNARGGGHLPWFSRSDAPGSAAESDSGECFPASYANGYVFFTRANTLMAQPFDAGRLRIEGAPVSVAENVLTTWFGTGAFSVSPSGTLVYRTGSAAGSVQLTWVDRQGKTLSTVGSPGTDFGITLSPDGKRAVVKDTPYDVPGDLWTLDFTTGRCTRLTFRKDVYSPASGLQMAPGSPTPLAISATSCVTKLLPAPATRGNC